VYKKQNYIQILKVLNIIYNFKLRTVITNFYLQSCLQLNILHCPCTISQFINIHLVPSQKSATIFKLVNFYLFFNMQLWNLCMF